VARPAFPKSLPAFQQLFATEDSAFRFIVASRWPQGFRCPACGGANAFQRGDRLAMQCRGCARYITATAGTVMHGSHMSLRSWLLAAFLVVTDKRGISALQLQRALGLSRYETAFQMLHKLRSAMVAPSREKLRGTVEVDETYIGGPEPGVSGRAKGKKTLVVGAVEVRDEAPGRIRLKVIPDARAPTLHAFIQGQIEPGSTIVTDGHHGYWSLEGYDHRPHVRPRGAIGDEAMRSFHTAIGNLKAWLLGTHHGAVSRKHLQRYLEEFTFRYNRRGNLKAAFQTLLGLTPKVRATTYGGLYRASDPNP
jgi:transposase-like protein